MPCLFFCAYGLLKSNFVVTAGSTFHLTSSFAFKKMWILILVTHIHSFCVEVLERVQKAATNLVPQYRKYSYPVRLKKIGITSLKDRKLIGLTIEVYKLFTVKEQIDYKQFFT